MTTNSCSSLDIVHGWGFVLHTLPPPPGSGHSHSAIAHLMYSTSQSVMYQDCLLGITPTNCVLVPQNMVACWSTQPPSPSSPPCRSLPPSLWNLAAATVPGFPPTTPPAALPTPVVTPASFFPSPWTTFPVLTTTPQRPPQPTPASGGKCLARSTLTL
jgi:hypothetical protein